MTYISADCGGGWHGQCQNGARVLAPCECACHDADPAIVPQAPYGTPEHPWLTLQRGDWAVWS